MGMKQILVMMAAVVLVGCAGTASSGNIYQSEEAKYALQDNMLKKDFGPSAPAVSTPITPANDTTSKNPYAVADRAGTLTKDL